VINVNVAGLLAADERLTLWINQHHNVVLDWLLMPISWFGEAGIGWIAIILILLILGGHRERMVTLVFVGGLVLTEYVLMPHLRELWPRPRPYTYIAGMRQLGVPWDKSSFPSAHAHLWTQAAILYGLTCRRWLWPLIVLSLLTFYSRPYAGAHHVLDVMAGVGLGGIMGFLELMVATKLGLAQQESECVAAEPVPETEPSPEC